MTTPAPSYLVGLIGAGIGSSVTPALHESEADAAGLRYLYRTIDIDVLGYGVDATVELIRRAGDLGYDALNITHPCKLAAIDALDEVSPDVALLGSVNTVLFRDGRAIGHNTDHSGFARGLRDGLAGRPRDAVLLVGAGGAGAAIAYALLSAGVRRLEIADAAPTRTGAVMRALAPAFPDAELRALALDEVADAAARVDGLVNATPVGMVGHDGIPVDAALLRPPLWVADAVYRPVRTQLIAAADDAGCAVLDGGRMVLNQAADTFRLITGIEPDRERMRAVFLDRLGAATLAG